VRLVDHVYRGVDSPVVVDTFAGDFVAVLAHDSNVAGQYRLRVIFQAEVDVVGLESCVSKN